jgi:hypothetical protein
MDAVALWPLSEGGQCFGLQGHLSKDQEKKGRNSSFLLGRASEIRNMCAHCCLLCIFNPSKMSIPNISQMIP